MTPSETYLGWQIVTAENCFETIRSLGIKPWQKITNPVQIDTWIQTATSSQKNDYECYSPKIFTNKYKNPHNNSSFDAFKIDFKPYSLVFVIIDNKYVVTTAEWKHGNDKITIVPVCGAVGEEESHLLTLSEKMEAVAFREWREETGLELENVIPLSSSLGMFSSVRNSDNRCFPYLGKLKYPLIKNQTNFDHSEHLAVVLFPLQEWVRLVEDNSLIEKNQDFGLEDCVRATTYVALRKLGILSLSI